MFNRLYRKVGANSACNCWSNLGSVHQVPITAGWTKVVWNMKFARHFYTWPALGIEPKTFWSWVQCPIHWETCSQKLCNKQCFVMSETIPSEMQVTFNYNTLHLLCPQELIGMEHCACHKGRISSNIIPLLWGAGRVWGGSLGDSASIMGCINVTLLLKLQTFSEVMVYRLWYNAKQEVVTIAMLCYIYVTVRLWHQGFHEITRAFSEFVKLLFHLGNSWIN